MSRRVRSIMPVIITILIFLVSAGPVRAGQVDNGIYAGLLRSCVRQGLVDYDRLQDQEGALDQYLELLERTDVDSLERNERFAYYINLYNAWTLKLILMHYPGIDSIRDIGGLFSSPWGMDIVRTGGEVVSLDHVEHEILRPEFQDYRVHAAINCSAISCPPLLDEPFEGESLDFQLDQVFRSFVNNPRLNRVEDGELWLSEIFSWFEEDFTPNVLAVVRQWAGPELAQDLDALGPEPELEYLDYDWGLNTL